MLRGAKALVGSCFDAGRSDVSSEQAAADTTNIFSSALDPAALKADLHTVGRGGTVIVNEDSFTQRNIEKAGFDSDPLDDGTLDGYQVFRVPMTSITVPSPPSVNTAS